MSATVSLAPLYKFGGWVVSRIEVGLSDDTPTILYADESDSFLFCTSDKVAIRVLAMLGLSDSGVSFEEVLGLVGSRNLYPTSTVQGTSTDISRRDKPLEFKGKEPRTTNRRMVSTRLFQTALAESWYAFPEFNRVLIQICPDH